MSRLARSCRALAVGIVAAAGTLSMTQVADAATPGPHLPPGAESIGVDPGNEVFLVGHAKGFQIYTCDGATWGAATPDAKLFDDNGKLVAKHFAGPTWQAKDGSKVVGVLPPAAKVTVDAAAIPWLKLSADREKTTGPGLFGNTTFIQRVATAGGLPPAAADCKKAGKKEKVPYTADYYFWKATGA
jgi:Protein of unknown function (DUF3455)